MNLLGKTFGYLDVVGNSAREGYVICRCKRCGNFKDIRATSLTKRKSPTRSCGCLQKEFASEVSSKTLSENAKENIEMNRSFNTNFGSIQCERPKNNSSGCKGVSWNKGHKKWQAYIGIHGRTIKLGYFENIEDAITARKNAEEEYHKPLLEARETVISK